MKLARLIWKNAVRNRRRTALTILSIAVSMFLVSTLQAVLSSMYRSQNSKQGSPHLRVVVHRATSITQAMPEAYRAKVKSPLEFIASSLRAVGGDTDAGMPIITALDRMGHPMFQYEAPSGYSDRASTWINSSTLL